MGIKLNLHSDKAMEENNMRAKMDTEPNGPLAFLKKKEETAETETVGETKTDESQIRIKRVIILKCGMLKTVMGAGYNKLQPKDELILKRESNGTDDKWSIAVYTTDGMHIGFLPYEMNQSTARLMDAGKNITAMVESQSDPDIIDLLKIEDDKSLLLPVTVFWNIEVEEE